MSWIARSGAVAAMAGILGLGMTGSALAAAGTGSGNSGQQVSACAYTMLPGDLGSHGSISMTMPNGTSMYFGTFGAMVTYMQSQSMCS